MGQLDSIKIQNKHITFLEFYFSHTNLLIIVMVVVLFLLLSIALSYIFWIMSKKIKVLEYQNSNNNH